MAGTMLCDLLKAWIADQASRLSPVQPGLPVGCIVALLALAQLESISAVVRPGDGATGITPMQTAQQAATWRGRHPQAALLIQLAEALNNVTATGALIRFVSWLATSGPIATASAVLLEALPALERMACTSEASRTEQAEADSRWEWAPMAAALRRRLP